MTVRPAMSPLEEAAYRRGLEAARDEVHRMMELYERSQLSNSYRAAYEIRQAINRLLGQT